MRIILGIESSCDECSAALVQHGPDGTFRVLKVATFSQVQLHQPFGGVVPEIASRSHLETINSVIDDVYSDSVDAIAVTNRPGLVGALLVGVSAAKSLAYALDKPLVPIHHLEGHAASIFLDRSTTEITSIDYPLLLAIVSGGHTNLYVARENPEKWPLDFLKQSLVGKSRDDAAGEAFDKTAKALGFPYPGGVWIDRLSEKGDPQAFTFPRALPQKSVLDYSFSGLKTAVCQTIESLRQAGTLEESLPDLCASIQEAIIDALLSKIYLAGKKFECKSLAVVGGVASNSRLRDRLNREGRLIGLSGPVLFPHPPYCTDNAAMIAAAGAIRLNQGHGLRVPEMLTLNAIANPER